MADSFVLHGKNEFTTKAPSVHEIVAVCKKNPTVTIGLHPPTKAISFSSLLLEAFRRVLICKTGRGKISRGKTHTLLALASISDAVVIHIYTSQLV